MNDLRPSYQLFGLQLIGLPAFSGYPKCAFTEPIKDFYGTILGRELADAYYEWREEQFEEEERKLEEKRNLEKEGLDETFKSVTENSTNWNPEQTKEGFRRMYNRLWICEEEMVGHC